MIPPTVVARNALRPGEMARVVPELEDLGKTVTRRLAGGMERLRLVGSFARVGALGSVKMPVTRRASNDRGSNGGLSWEEGRRILVLA